MLGLLYGQVLVRGVAVWVGCSMGELGSEVGAVWWLPCSSWAVGRLQCGEDAV